MYIHMYVRIGVRAYICVYVCLCVGVSTKHTHPAGEPPLSGRGSLRLQNVQGVGHEGGLRSEHGALCSLTAARARGFGELWGLGDAVS